MRVWVLLALWPSTRNYVTSLVLFRKMSLAVQTLVLWAVFVGTTSFVPPQQPKITIALAQLPINANLAEAARVDEVIINEWRLTSAPKTVLQSLRSCPALLAAMSSKSKSQWFAEVGRIPKDRLMRMIERHPNLLSKAITSKSPHTPRSIISKELPLTEQQWKRLMRNNKGLLCIPRRQLRQVLCFLNKTLELSPQEGATLVSAHPRILSCRVSHFRCVFNFFHLELQLPVEKIHKMVVRWPSMLFYRVDSHLRPNVNFLRNLGSADWMGWKLIVVSYPQVLTLSLESLKEKLPYLSRLFGIAACENLVARYPPLFWLSPSLLESKVNFLKEELRLSAQELELVLETFPQVLGLAVEANLQPKIQFLRQYLTEDKLKEFVLYQPSLLAYSMENRLRPRIRKMTEASISLAYSPLYIMGLTDSKFEHW